jgi:hypothetical protein
MNTILAAAALSIAALAASAPIEAAPDEVRLITCWYDANGQLTGAVAAAHGEKPGPAVQQVSGGDHAWSYTVVGDGPSACPAKLPVSSRVSQ